MNKFQREYVDAVKAHASANYDKDGWDIIVECWGDEEILEEVATCTSVKSAIQSVEEVAKILNSHRSDILGTIF